MIDEKISAFLDGESDRNEVLEVLGRLEREPALRTTLIRHHHARACLRGDLHPGLDAGFANRVMAAIAAEDAVEEARSQKVVALPLRRHLRTFAGLAMAASVAGFAILAMQSFPLNNPLSSLLTARNTPSNAASLAAADLPAAAQQAAGQPVRWEQLPPDAAAQLNSYLISHNSSAMDGGLGGSLGFMRVAAYDNNEDAQADH